MFFATLGMVMVLYMTVLLYGVNVMRSILEEKTSRIMEVMLSTASAKELMAGKILGVGAVGLTQVAIWVATALIFSAGPIAAGADLLKGVLSLNLLISFAIYFLLGYVLYSTLCAAVGSMVNSEQEAQQLQFVIMMPMILSVVVIIRSFSILTRRWPSGDLCSLSPRRWSCLRGSPCSRGLCGRLHGRSRSPSA